MRQYLDLLNLCLDTGTGRSDRTGVGTQSILGHQMRFDLQAGFPLVTTKKIHLKSIIYELLWMLSGSTDVRALQANGVTIWNEWVTKEECARFGRSEGLLGPVYGHQWRNFGATEDPDYKDEYLNDGVDQIYQLVQGIQQSPGSRRLILTGWNPKEIDRVALPPCHTLSQFFVVNGKLSCSLYQRSGDLFLGVPFNIASYALLTMMLAQVTNLQSGTLIHTIGDAHIYANHHAQVRLQVAREPRTLPKMVLNPKVTDIFEFKYEDFSLEGYDPHPRIPAPVAV